MRNLNKLFGTGAFFLCLGGWVYSSQVTADGPATQAGSTNPIDHAVAAAAVGEAVQPADNSTLCADKAPSMPAFAAPATAPAPTTLAAPVAPPPVAPAPAPAAADNPPPDAPAPVANDAPPANLNSATVDVAADGTITNFDAPDLEINTALYLLSLQTKRNIIASKEVKGTVNAHLHNVTFAEALDALLTPNGFGYVEKGNFIYVYSDKELEDIRKRDRKTVNKVFLLKYMNAADAAILVKPVLSTVGQVALTPAPTVGIPVGQGETGGENYATDDTLVVNDYPENLNDVSKTLAELDVRPKQVLVEATILRATLQEDNALGVDLVSLSGIDIGGLAGAVSNNASGGSSGSGNTISTPGQLAGNTLFNPTGTTPTQVNAGTNFASQVPAGGLSVGFLSNHVSVFIRALESTTDTTVVANPKILALNKHRGDVFIGQEFGYKTTSTTTTTTDETIEFLDTGTRLTFRPFITDDGYVRMEIHPEDSSGGLDSNQLPEKQSTEVTSNIMIKDGRTVVIGGLFREQTVGSRSQVPVIGNIPILGVPFRETADSTQRTETIVLITPHIINDDTAMYEEAEKQQEDVTRQMLGNRAGLQPWGRDRLAQTWYSLALKEQEKGNNKKALMYTDWALNSNSHFIEAIKLREQLSGKRYEEADESSIRGFIHDIIRDDAANMPNTGLGGHYPPPAPATQP